MTLGMTGISNVCVVLAPKFTGYCDPGHTKLFDLKSCFFAPNRASLRPGCAEADKLGRCANLGMFPFLPGHVRRSRS